MSETPSEYSDGSEYSYNSGAPSTLGDLLQRFTIEAKPEVTLKLRSQFGPLVLGADLTRITGAGSNVGALVIKPSNRSQPWRRLRVDNSGMMTLRSRKIQWWLFTFDFSAHANPVSRTFDFSYRAATKWDIPRGEIKNKKAHELGENTEARVHYNISYSLPAIDGSIGTAARRGVSRETHTDVGYAHLDIPRVELVVWPGGRHDAASSAPAAPAEPAGSGGCSAAECGTEAAAGGSTAGGGSSGVVGAAGEARAGAPGGVSGGAIGSGAAPPWGHISSRQQQGVRRLAGRLGAAIAGSSGGAGAGDHSAQQRRQACLRELSSHLENISGRWWDASGGSFTTASGGMARWSPN